VDRKNFEDAVGAFLRAEPFRPFVLEMASGRKVVIAEACDLAVRGGLAVGFGPDDRPFIFDHEGVVAVRHLPPENPRAVALGEGPDAPAVTFGPDAGKEERS
jgi:hypothetical protein